ncbi:MAG: elongation factor 4 [Candidatus Vogelbacteria bacterium]|nr:elongation factor 4 [Candidatus Vogelbacteria bacterium]
MVENIRNFSIIAHIDHGKSTLADRFLELTGTIESRRMRAQVLDSMDLERERGITIKMAPVTMSYRLKAESYKLNLIDTPGHIDFSYEVSRALRAVEGAVLLVDATKGVQAQTFSVLEAAKALGMVIVPAVNKIDLPLARPAAVKSEIAKIVGCPEAEILEVSAKTGAGVEILLAAIIARVPPPVSDFLGPRALVFDFEYSSHRGLVVYVRLFDGSLRPGDELVFAIAGEKFTALEVGVFRPEKQPVSDLRAGEIGYIVTGMKESSRAKVGETILGAGQSWPLVAGYAEPKPMVWASLYPVNQSDFDLLRQALARLKLSDAALTFEEEAVGVMGRGWRAGFLGLLHLEIVAERLRREHGLSLVVTAPTTSFRVNDRQTGQTKTIYAPHLFPDGSASQTVTEPWVAVRILTPPEHLSAILALLQSHEARLLTTDNWGDGKIIMRLELPLRELMRHFFDRLKTVSSGFASLAYELIDWRPAEAVKLEVLIAEEAVPALTRVVSRRRLAAEAEAVVERLKTFLPRELFVVKIQARALGRIIASRSLSALKKDVTGYLYGGDITRKKKLWAKQAKGKKRLKARGRVKIPPEVFLKLVQENRAGI